MRAGRAALLAVLLLGTVGVEAVYAAPASSIATLRATACCAAKCPKARRGAAECCQVSQVAQEPASFSKAKPSPPPSVIATATGRETIAARPGRTVFVAPREVFARPAPIFLIDRSLRL